MFQKNIPAPLINVGGLSTEILIFSQEWKTTCLPADEMRIFEQTREHKTTQVVPQVSFEIHESFPRNVFSVWSKFQRGLTPQQRGIDQQSEVS